jgi:hypothetical protein
LLRIGRRAAWFAACFVLSAKKRGEVVMNRYRVLILAGALLAACGTEDDRPATVEVVALEILAPSCGAVQCHSTTTRTEGLAFDTLDATKDTLNNELGLGKLVQVIDDKEMPPDSPMFENDVALIKKWIAAGAPGL